MTENDNPEIQSSPRPTEPESSASGEGVGRESDIYQSRFTSEEERTRAITWEVLCRDFLQRLIPAGAVVVDIGAGDGHFLRNISAKKRIAVDLSEHVKDLEREGVEVHVIPATDLTNVLAAQVDVVHMSNFLEHLPSKRVMLEVLEESRKALKPEGKLIILQPNIRYVGSSYWDYVDHNIAITERSLVEALEATGFEVEQLIPRFLPYTAKSTIGRLVKGEKFAWIISCYLKFPLLWRLFGQQTFVVARPRTAGYFPLHIFCTQISSRTISPGRHAA